MYAQTDRELLITVATKVDEMHNKLVGEGSNPGLISRVESLEKAKHLVKGWIAGVSAVLTAIFALLEWLIHGSSHR